MAETRRALYNLSKMVKNLSKMVKYKNIIKRTISLGLKSDLGYESPR